MIYLDLDGVFADFDKKLKELNITPRHPDRWKVIEQVDNFFLHLHVIDRSKELFDTIYYGTHDNVAILTAAPQPTQKLKTAVEDKVHWVRKHLHRNVPVIVTNGWENKIKYHYDGDILIDDMQRNIDHWQSVGGRGICHVSGDNETTLSALSKLLNNI
jgi:5'(3')-deoxyribonucleotidase